MGTLLKRLPRPFLLGHHLLRRLPSAGKHPFATMTSDNEDNEWNDAWESAWLPDTVSAAAKNRAPWEIDVNFSSPSVVLPADVDPETKAFVQEMDESWDERRRAAARGRSSLGRSVEQVDSGGRTMERKKGLEEMKRDYRVKKQRIHAALWMREIEKEEEAQLDDNLGGGGGDGIEKLLDSCSQFFYSGTAEVNDVEVPSASEFKTKPDGWETTAKGQDGNPWEMSQREEDILLQEFERRIAFSKFQIASFIKSHIFSRRRPIDGWKYMIEELGPNSKKGKGSVLRLPAVSDAATQPFKEEKQHSQLAGRLPSRRGR